MKLYKIEEDKYLEDEGLLYKILGSTNIDMYIEDYEKENKEKEDILSRITCFREKLEEQNNILKGKKGTNKLLFWGIIILFLLDLVIDLNSFLVLGLVILLYTKIWDLFYYGTKKSVQEKIEKIEGKIETEEFSLLNIEQRLRMSKNLIKSCLDTKVYPEEERITEDKTIDKPLVRVRENNI